MVAIAAPLACMTAPIARAQILAPAETATIPQQSAPAAAPPQTTGSTVAAPSRPVDANVAPLKRVAPRTPALPTVISRAIAKSTRTTAPARVRGTAGKPMTLGAGTVAKPIACQPGETFVRRLGQCQKRKGAAVKAARPAAAKGKSAVAGGKGRGKV